MDCFGGRAIFINARRYDLYHNGYRFSALTLDCTAGTLCQHVHHCIFAQEMGREEPHHHYPGPAFTATHHADDRPAA